MNVGGEDLQHHWEIRYQRDPSQLSWYQPQAGISMELISGLDLPPAAAIIDVGGGESPLVDELLAAGFQNVTVLDISQTALDTTRSRIGPAADRVTWIRQDLTEAWIPGRQYRLWHDRAVFHFCVDPDDRATYLKSLRTGVAPQGYVVMASFAPDGPERCSGLPVARYGPEELVRQLGPEFALRSTRREEHVTPAGVIQPFTWIVAQRA